MAKVRVYRTINGDTWDLIAYKVYGKEQYFHKLIRANLNLRFIQTSTLEEVTYGISEKCKNSSYI